MTDRHKLSEIYVKQLHKIRVHVEENVYLLSQKARLKPIWKDQTTNGGQK